LAVSNRNEGANTMMAGTSIGAAAPHSLAPVSAPTRALHRVPAVSRTRRNHGVFLLGDELTTVYSSRRERDCLGVTITVGNGPLVLSGSFTSAQARVMAEALVAAAAASDAVCQRGEA
jgi:hypothetical protein